MKTKIVSLIVCMLLFATTLSIALTATFKKTTDNQAHLNAIDGWPMLSHDPARTGYSTSMAPSTNHTLFKTIITGSVLGGISVNHGKGYVSTIGKHLYCFDAYTGAIIFDYTNPGALSSVPVIEGNLIYFGSYDKNIYCMNASTGSIIWSRNTSNSVYSSPALVNGKLYFGGQNNKMMCLDTNGNWLWNYTTAGIVQSSPAVVDGKVYFGSNDKKIYCLNADSGAFIWSYLTGGTVAKPITFDNGKVYAASTDNNLYCLNAINGSKLWQFSISTPPALAVNNGKVYIGSNTVKFYCLNAETGSQLWNYTALGIIYSTPAIADGKVYFGDWGYTIYCLNADTGSFIWKYKDGTQSLIQSAFAIYDGILYAAGNKIYAFQTNTNNTPPLTPSQPEGPTTGKINVEYTYTTHTTDPENNQVWYQWKFGSYTTSWLGPYASGETVSTSYTWTVPGTYNVTVKAKDNHTAESGWSMPLTVVISANQPPGTPNQPTGPTSGYTGVSYTYSTSPVTDPDGDQVSYLFDWGDTMDSGWVTTPSASHSWNAVGTYNVRVKAKDTFNASSGWSSSLAVTITAPKPNLTIDSITGGKGITMVIKNEGAADATNVIWNITIDGGLFVIPRRSNGTIPSLAAGNTSEVTMSVFGFGLGLLKPLPTITAHAVCTEGVSAEKTVSAKIFFSKVTIQ